MQDSLVRHQSGDNRPVQLPGLEGRKRTEEVERRDDVSQPTFLTVRLHCRALLTNEFAPLRIRNKAFPARGGLAASPPLSLLRLLSSPHTCQYTTPSLARDTKKRPQEQARRDCVSQISNLPTAVRPA